MTVRLPGEFEPHERTVLCWPARRGLYGNRFAQAEEAHAHVATTIAEFEPTTVLVNPDQLNRAQALCGNGVEVVEMAMDDAWFRDTGPVYVFDGSERIATSWIFNGWGNKFNPHDHDATLATRWAQLAGHMVSQVDMVFEGGSITGNGDGMIVTTSQCLLNLNRNPRLSQRDIESRLAKELGAQQVIWLPYGLALDDDTDGHVDNVAAFADAKTIVVQGCADESELDHGHMNANFDVLRQFQEANDHPLHVIEIPVLPFVEVDGERLVVPYLNFYIGNGFVLLPTCGHRADNEMMAIIATVFPDRKVIGLEVGAILALGGGGIHCITQQIPAI